MKSSANLTPPLAPYPPALSPVGEREQGASGNRHGHGEQKRVNIRKIKKLGNKKPHKPYQKFMGHAILFSATRAFEFANATKHLYFVAFAHARIKRDRRNKIIVLLAFA